MEVVQSELSLHTCQAPNEDKSGDSYSTGTASKAIGKRYGSTKIATLVVFKIADYFQSETVVVFKQSTPLSSSLLLVCATVKV